MINIICNVWRTFISTHPINIMRNFRLEMFPRTFISTHPKYNAQFETWNVSKSLVGGRLSRHWFAKNRARYNFCSTRNSFFLAGPTFYCKVQSVHCVIYTKLAYFVWCSFRSHLKLERMLQICFKRLIKYL